MTTSRLQPEVLGFLRELAAHNERPWFQENKERFLREVQAPVLALLEAFAPRLRRVSRHFVVDARPNGGSLMRIYRDVRFSKDKSPYRTHLGASFAHRGGGAMGAPGWYMHLAPGASFVGGGIWHPEGPTLARIRDAIVKTPNLWSRVRRAPGLGVVWRLGGDALKRPPRGVPPDHPFVEDLKRKDFIAAVELTDRQVCSPDLLDRLEQAYRIQAPLMSFLCKALRLPF